MSDMIITNDPTVEVEAIPGPEVDICPNPNSGLFNIVLDVVVASVKVVSSPTSTEDGAFRTKERQQDAG